MAHLFTAAAFVTTIQALAFDGKLPKPTHSVVPDATFHLPETTEPPSLKELAKRQNGQTVLIGPDNTCGYFDGRPGAVYSCNGADVTCAFVTTSSVGAVACCSDGDCGLRVNCLDYSDIYLSDACDNGCYADTYTVKCTNINYPYCGTVTFFDGIMDYFCDTLSYSTPQQLYTTYDGEDDGRSFTPVVVTISDDISSTNTDFFATDDSDSSTSTAPSSPSSSSGSNNGSSNSSSSSPNIGAIVGGVVGGVAVIVLIALGIFFLVRHNKKKKNNNNTPPAQQPEVQQNIGPNGPAPGTGYTQPPYGQQPAYGTPPQGYYAGADQKPAGFVAMAPTSPPDRNDSTSPVSVSQFSDPSRHSVQQQQQYPYQPTSPTSTINSSGNMWAQQQQQYQTPPPVGVPPTVHEAGGNAVGDRDYNANHHGQFHELS